MICGSGLVEACTISSNKQGWGYDEIGEREEPQAGNLNSVVQAVSDCKKEIDRPSNQHIVAKARPPPMSHVSTQEQQIGF